MTFDVGTPARALLSHLSYLPQVSRVPGGSRLQFIQQEGDPLKWADPGSLRDPLSRTDPVTQPRNRTGAQTHLHTHVTF